MYHSSLKVGTEKGERDFRLFKVPPPMRGEPGDKNRFMFSTKRDMACEQTGVVHTSTHTRVAEKGGLPHGLEHRKRSTLPTLLQLLQFPCKNDKKDGVLPAMGLRPSDYAVGWRHPTKLRDSTSPRWANVSTPFGA